MSGVVRLLLIGPLVVLILMSFLAVIALLAGAMDRLERLTAFGRRTVKRLSRGRGLLFVWGFAAFLLTLLAAAVLINIKALALLGLIVAVLGLALAAFGLGVGAASGGRGLAAALGQPEAPPVFLLVLGLSTFFIAAFVPILGWLVVVIAMLNGVGATLETLFRPEI